MSYEDGEDLPDDWAGRRAGPIDEGADEAAVQAQDCAAEDESMLESPEEESPDPDPEPFSFIKLLTSLVFNLVLWYILFVVNLGAQMLVVWCTGSGPSFVWGAWTISRFLFLVLILTTSLELLLIRNLPGAVAEKPKSSEAPRSDS